MTTHQREQEKDRK